MRRIFLLLLCLSGGLVCGAERPNIVYIIADDQSWTDFGFMGSESVHTPNLDALAANSARFPNGYLPTSVCRPSLVTLLTGLYPHEHQVHFNHGPPGNSAYNKMTSVEEYVQVRSKEFDLIKKVPTLPGVLGQCGYRSLQTGKFWEGHWKNGGFTDGMTVFEAPPRSQTYGGVRKLASGDRVAHGNGDWGLQIGRETMQPIWDFVADCKKEDAPWLIWYAPYLPHQPHDSPERFYDIARQMPGIEPHQIPYYASIAQFDETVGDLVRFVEEHSDLSNTIFVFVSDNGWSASKKPQKGREVEFAHTKNSKRAPFDEGVRSPILFRWDGVIEPETHEELVSSVDIVPTLLAASGCEPIEGQGVNLLPAMKGETDLDSERAVFGEIYPGDATSLGHPDHDIAYRWVRQGDFKLIVPHGEKPWGGYLDQVALYNVASDPTESVNLAGEAKVEGIRENLQNLLDVWWSPNGARK
ncbi:MAG: sulfatase [Verrucomicrobiales bacterium]|nr:sulfatase [Verrucomicrobiales bacterium]